MRNHVTAYTFDASAKTVTFTAVGTLVQEKILGIWNITRGAKLYDPHVSGYGGQCATNVLTLDVDTTSHADTDKLLIFYEGVQSDALATQQTLSDVLTAIGTLVTNSAFANYQNEFGYSALPAANSDTGTHSLIALVKRLLVHQSTLIGKDYATETTLAQILTAVGNQLQPSDLTGLAQESTQQDILSELALLLSELQQKVEPSHLTGLATTAKQDAQSTLLSDILAELRDDVFVSQMLWEDETNKIFYREERVRSQDDGSITTVYTRLSDNVVVGSLPAGVIPVETSDVRTVESTRYKVTAGGTGYSIGDWLIHTNIIDTTGSGEVVNSFWYNISTGSNIAAPNGDDVTISTDAVLADTNGLLGTLLDNVGATNETVAGTDTATSGLNGLFKRLLQRVTTLITNIGTQVYGSGTKAAAQRVTLATDDSLHDKLPAALTAGGNLKVAIQEFTTLNIAGMNQEDTDSKDRDPGMPILAVRKATPANTSGTDGDYEFLQMDAGALWAKLAAALPAGSAIIGKVGIDQSTPGTTNGVQITVAIPAGANIIGKVGIDQSTPGTTNNVEVSKLPKAATANTPAIQTSSGDMISSNTSRKAWGVQNLGTNPIFVRMGTGASSTLFHFCLKGGTANDDGQGSSIQDDMFTGVVSVSGTSPRFVVYEL